MVVHVMYGIDAADAQDAIRQAGRLLLDSGHVKDTYVDAVCQRETEYPTGLQLKNMGVAMPHTAGVHVNDPAVCVVRLNHPVTFFHMGEPETAVEVKLMFMMAIKDPDAQLDTLQQVMGVFTNDRAMDEFMQASDEPSLYQVAKTYIG